MCLVVGQTVDSSEYLLTSNLPVLCKEFGMCASKLVEFVSSPFRPIANSKGSPLYIAKKKKCRRKQAHKSTESTTQKRQQCRSGSLWYDSLFSSYKQIMFCLKGDQRLAKMRDQTSELLCNHLSIVLENVLCATGFRRKLFVLFTPFLTQKSRTYAGGV